MTIEGERRDEMADGHSDTGTLAPSPVHSQCMLTLNSDESSTKQSMAQHVIAGRRTNTSEAEAHALTGCDEGTWIAVAFIIGIKARFDR